MPSIDEKPEFQLMGGDVSLDFANTLDNRGRPNETDLLRSYQDLIAFARETNMISAAEAQYTMRAAERIPAAADKALRQARTLREAIFAIFSATAAEEPPPSHAIQGLNSVLRDAGSNRVLSVGKNRVSWQWLQRDENLEWILWPIAMQAANLLSSSGLVNVRSCASATCDWLFLDHSKSHSRRWCDMRTCGNRSKARRFYQTKRREAGASSRL